MNALLWQIYEPISGLYLTLVKGRFIWTSNPKSALRLGSQDQAHEICLAAMNHTPGFFDGKTPHIKRESLWG